MKEIGQSLLSVSKKEGGFKQHDNTTIEGATLSNAENFSRQYGFLSGSDRSNYSNFREVKGSIFDFAKNLFEHQHGENAKLRPAKQNVLSYFNPEIKMSKNTLDPMFDGSVRSLAEVSREGYDYQELKDYVDKIGKANSGVGTIIELDIETLGSNPHYMSENLTESTDATRRYFAMTEISVIESKVKDGVLESTSTHSIQSQSFGENLTDREYQEILEDIKNAKDTQARKVMIDRLAGYAEVGEDGAVLKDHKRSKSDKVIFTAGNNINDDEVLLDGMKNVSKFNHTGSKAHVDEVADLVEYLENVTTRVKGGEDVIFQTRNGEMFDLPQIYGYLSPRLEAQGENKGKNAIVEELNRRRSERGVEDFSLKDFASELNSVHSDTSVLSNQFLSDQVEWASKNMPSGSGVNNTMDSKYLELEQYHGQEIRSVDALDYLVTKHNLGAEIKADTKNEFAVKMASSASGLGYSDDHIKNILTEGASAYQHTAEIDVIAQSYESLRLVEIARDSISNAIDSERVEINATHLGSRDELRKYDGGRAFVAKETVRASKDNLSFKMEDGDVIGAVHSKGVTLRKGRAYGIQHVAIKDLIDGESFENIDVLNAVKDKVGMSNIDLLDNALRNEALSPETVFAKFTDMSDTGSEVVMTFNNMQNFTDEIFSSGIFSSTLMTSKSVKSYVNQMDKISIGESTSLKARSLNDGFGLLDDAMFIKGAEKVGTLRPLRSGDRVKAILDGVTTDKFQIAKEIPELFTDEITTLGNSFAGLTKETSVAANVLKRSKARDALLNHEKVSLGAIQELFERRVLVTDSEDTYLKIMNTKNKGDIKNFISGDDISVGEQFVANMGVDISNLGESSSKLVINKNRARKMTRSTLAKVDKIQKNLRGSEKTLYSIIDGIDQTKLKTDPTSAGSIVTGQTDTVIKRIQRDYVESLSTDEKIDILVNSNKELKSKWNAHLNTTNAEKDINLIASEMVAKRHILRDYNIDDRNGILREGIGYIDESRITNKKKKKFEKIKEQLKVIQDSEDARINNPSKKELVKRAKAKRKLVTDAYSDDIIQSDNFLSLAKTHLKRGDDLTNADKLSVRLLNGDLTNLDFTSQADLQTRLQVLSYGQFPKELSGSKIRRDNQIKEYMTSMSKDFLDRGLLNQESFDNIEKISGSNKTTVQALTSYLSTSLMDDKEEVLGLANELVKDAHKLTNTEKIQELARLKITDDIESKSGFSIDKLLEVSDRAKLYQDTVLKDSVILNDFTLFGTGLDGQVKKIVKTKEDFKASDYIDNLIKDTTVFSENTIMTNSVVSEEAKKGIEDVLNVMQEELNYTDDNKSMLRNILGHKVFTSGVQTEKGEMITPGYDILQGKDGIHMVVHTGKKRYLEDLRGAESIEDLKKNNIVLKFDKIEGDDLYGKYISQGEKSRKALYSSIDARVDDDNIVFKVTDAVSESLNETGNSLEFAIKSLMDGKADYANSKLNKGKKIIHESKTMVSDAYSMMPQFDDSGAFTGLRSVMQIGTNLSDTSKTSTLDISQLMLALPEVFDHNAPLLERFKELVEPNALGYGDTLVGSLESLVGNIKDNKNYLNKYTSIIGDDFVTLSQSPSVRLFFTEHLSDIASTMLDMDGGKKYSAIENTLLELKEKGSQSVLAIKSNDGSANTINTKLGDYVFGFPFMNFARAEGAVQGAGGESLRLSNIDSRFIKEGLTPDIIKQNGDYVGSTNVVDVGEWLNSNSITPGGSFVPREIQELKEARFAGDDFTPFEKGFSEYTAKIKFMTAEEYALTTKGLRENGNEFREKVVSSLADKGYEMNQDLEYVLGEMSTRFSGVSLFEDSSYASSKLRYLKNPTNIKSYKVDNPTLEVGAEIKKGDFLGLNGERNIVADFDGVISNSLNGELHLQIAGGENAIKFNVANVERSMGTMLNLEGLDIDYSQNQVQEILSVVEKELMGDASIIMNPGIKKHEAITIPMQSRLLNITQNISNKEDANVVNEAMKETADLFNMSVELNLEQSKTLGRDIYSVVYDQNYQGTKTIKDGYGPLDEILKLESTILENASEGFANKINTGLEEINVHNIAPLSITNAPFSVANRYNESSGHSGTSFNIRRMVALSQAYDPKDVFANEMAVGLHEDDFRKWMLDGVYDNKQGMAEVQNVLYAYEKAITGTNMTDVSVKDMSLDDITIIGGQIDAKDLSDMFNPEALEGFNMVRLDVSNMKLQRPTASFLNKESIDRISLSSDPKSLERLAFQESDYVSEILIPIVSANQVDGSYNLHEVQKGAADLIRSLQDLDSGDSKFGIDDMRDRVNKNYEKYTNKLAFELRDKDGMFMELFSNKSVSFSGRNLNQSVASAMYTDAEKKLTKHDTLGNVIEMIDGKRRYTNVVALNPNDFESKVMSFDDIGRAVLENRHALDEKAQFNVISKHYQIMTDSKMEGIETLDQFLNSPSRESIANSFDRDWTRSIGKTYMEEIGLEGIGGRAPYIRVDSDIAVMYRVSDSVNRGTSVSGLLESLKRKLDTDGDIEDFIFRSVGVKEDGTKYIKDFNDASRSGVRRKAYTTNISDLEMYNDEVASEVVNYKAHVLENFIASSNLHDVMREEESGTLIKNQAARLSGLNALQSKAIIGSASNPALYLKGATVEYAENLKKDGFFAEALSVSKSIATGALFVEQAAIDQKTLISKGADGIEAYNHIKRVKAQQRIYDNIYQSLSPNGNKSERNALRDSIEILMPYVVGADIKEIDGKMLAFNTSDGNAVKRGNFILTGYEMKNDGTLDDEMVNSLIDNILNKNYSHTDSELVVGLDRFLGDIREVLSDDKARSVYSSTMLSVNATRDINKTGDLILNELIDGTDENIINSYLYSDMLDIIRGDNLATPLVLNITKEHDTSSYQVLDKPQTLNMGETFYVGDDSNILPSGHWTPSIDEFKDGRHTVRFENEAGESRFMHIKSQADLDSRLSNLVIGDMHAPSRGLHAQDLGLMAEQKVQISNMNDDEYIELLRKARDGVESFVDYEKANHLLSLDPNNGNKVVEDYLNDLDNSKNFVRQITQKAMEEGIQHPFNEGMRYGAKSQLEAISRHIADASEISGLFNKDTSEVFINKLNEQLAESISDPNNLQSLINNLNESTMERASQVMVDHVKNTAMGNEGMIDLLGGRGIPLAGISSFVDDMLKVDVDSHMKEKMQVALDGMSKDLTLETLNQSTLRGLVDSMISSDASIKDIDKSRDEVARLVNEISKVVGVDHSENLAKVSSMVQLSHRQDFINEIKKIDNIGEYSPVWLNSQEGVKFKNLSSNTIKDLLSKSNEVEGLNQDFIDAYMSKVSSYVQVRDTQNIGAELNNVADIYKEIQGNDDIKALIDQFNEKTLERGSSATIDKKKTFDKAKDSLGDFHGKASQGIESAKDKLGNATLPQKTGWMLAGALGIATVGFVGHQRRKAINSMHKGEEENKKKKKSLVPMSKSIYSKDNGISVNVRARSRLTSGVSSTTASIANAMGANVNMHSTYRDDRSTMNHTDFNDMFEDYF